MIARRNSTDAKALAQQRLVRSARERRRDAPCKISTNETRYERAHAYARGRLSALDHQGPLTALPSASKVT